jgi:hypothetical protein
MNITAKIDNKLIKPKLSDFWFKTELLKKSNLEFFGFHALKISNLPSKGLLEVNTKFVGSTTGNYISFISLLLLLFIYIYFKIKKYCGKYALSDSPVQSPSDAIDVQDSSVESNANELTQ